MAGSLKPHSRGDIIEFYKLFWAAVLEQIVSIVRGFFGLKIVLKDQKLTINQKIIKMHHVVIDDGDMSSS